MVEEWEGFPRPKDRVVHPWWPGWSFLSLHSQLALFEWPNLYYMYLCLYAAFLNYLAAQFALGNVPEKTTQLVMAQHLFLC